MVATKNLSTGDDLTDGADARKADAARPSALTAALASVRQGKVRDGLASLALSGALLPLLWLTALLVRTGSPGSVLLGKNKPFEVLKFRTMLEEPDVITIPEEMSRRDLDEGEDYTEWVHDTANSLIETLAHVLDVPERRVSAFRKVIEDFAAAERETTAQPRLQWGKDNAPDENPAAFAWRAYEAEAKSGTLHMGLIRQDDKKNGTDLADKLVSWLRSPANRQQVPEGFDIPTKPEWNTRQLERRGGDLPSGRGTVRPDASRLYDAARYRFHAKR